MKKILLIILIIVVVILAFLVGVYFSKDIQNFQKIDVGNFIKEATKEVFNPAPLQVRNPFVNVTLTSDKILAETNLQRNLNGNLPPLSQNAILDASALAKAKDMFKNQYFEHVSPSGVSPSDLVKNMGYNYIVTGENLILGNFASEYELVTAWMNSPGHRANILNNRYTEIGVAVIKGTWKGETTWIGVQEFGLPMSACTQPDIVLKNQIDNLKTELENLSLQIDQKRQELDLSSNNYKKYNALVPVYNDLVRQYEIMAGNVKNLIVKYNNEVSVFNKCVAGSN